MNLTSLIMRKSNKTLLSKYDCQALQQLMQAGFSLGQTLHLMVNKQNLSTIKLIQTRLENGQKIEDFFGEYCPKEYRSYFHGFIQYLPFLECITLCNNILTDESKQKKELKKGLAYPCLLFFGVWIGVVFFSELCLPALVSLMAGFHITSTSFEVIRLVIRIGAGILSIFCLTTSILIIYFNNTKRKVQGYKLFQKYIPQSIICQYTSAEFVRFFLQCLKVNVSTKQSLSIIQAIPKKEIIVFLSKQIEESLLEGERMDKAMENKYLDVNLARFFKIAYYSGNMENMLESYLIMAKKRIQRQCQVFTKTVQIVSYCSIGLVLILVYQILMLPLSILSQI